MLQNKLKNLGLDINNYSSAQSIVYYVRFIYGMCYLPAVVPTSVISFAVSLLFFGRCLHRGTWWKVIFIHLGSRWSATFFGA